MLFLFYQCVWDCVLRPEAKIDGRENIQQSRESRKKEHSHGEDPLVCIYSDGVGNGVGSGEKERGERIGMGEREREDRDGREREREGGREEKRIKMQRKENITVADKQNSERESE